MRYYRIDNSSANGGKICPGPKIKKLHAESLCVKLDNHWHREFEDFDVDLGANIYDFSTLMPRSSTGAPGANLAPIRRRSPHKFAGFEPAVRKPERG
jgi:hypothetical protein